MKNIVKVVMVIIGTLIGAGFASGREIYLFFTRFGVLGQIGIVVSSIITGIIIYKVLNKTKENKIVHYKELLEKINPKYKKINVLISWVVNAFLLISFYIMIAGFSAYVNQIYQIPNIMSSIFFIFICYLVFRKSLNGVMKANEILVPLLIAFVIYLGIKNIPFLIQSKGQIYIETSNKGWLSNAILYASYNSIILIPVLTTLKNYITTKKDTFLISVFTSICILVLSFLIYGLLLKGQFYVKELELPLLQVALEFGNIYKYLYGFVIIISIFTSAISTGYSFIQNVCKSKKSYQVILILMCVSGVLISPIGFSKLVEILYPIFGFLGLVQIILLLK